MKYKNLQSLPKGVGDNLPLHAQEIYLSTYNNAFEDHKSEPDSKGIAHRIAWSAVKQTYEQTGTGSWQKIVTS